MRNYIQIVKFIKRLKCHLPVKTSAELFTREGGTKLTAEDRKIRVTAPALLSARCNFGGSAREMKLSEKAKRSDLVEILIARNDTAVFVNTASRCEDINLDALRRVFKGEVTDWKTLAGTPGPIQIVIPQIQTAC